MRKSAAILLFALCGCSTLYVPQEVRETALGVDVDVVVMSPQSVSAANIATPYSPRSLPSEFNVTAGTGGGLRTLGTLPDSPAQVEIRPSQPALQPPPSYERGPYVIGIGDVLVLSTPTSGGTVEELTGLLASQNRRQGYTVQDDGAITIPDVGRINVGGLTLGGAEDAIFSGLIERQVDPSFSLEIAEFNSQRVAIGGAVSSPLLLPIKLGPLFLNEAVAAAGGILIEDDEFATIRIYRDGNLYQIPLTDYLASDQWQRLQLKDMDSVFIDSEFSLERAEAYFEQQIRLAELRRSSRAAALAELETEISIQRSQLAERRDNFESQVALDAIDRDYVYLAGEVGEPQRVALPFGRQLFLADALFEAGGIAPSTGNPEQIYVLRSARDGSDVTVWHLDGSNVVNMLLATRFELRPSDIVFVAEQPITRWNRVVQQIVPTLITSGVAAVTR